MANRYLRATGNWNGSVWAATSGGTAGSAATPTADDQVFINANFSVTLTGDAECLSLEHTNGAINFGSYQLTIFDTALSETFVSSGNAARTIDMGSGSLKFNGQYGLLVFTGTNLNFIAGTSRIEMNVTGFDWLPSYFQTGSETFNDVVINMGYNTSDSNTLNITGSPTFRSLTIQSKNSAAHTVVFPDDGQSITVEKFIAIGSSSSNRLSLQYGSGGPPPFNPFHINLGDNGSVYGQNVEINLGFNYTEGNTPFYIGSNSVDNSTLGSNWLLQDPPKISTLVDPLTTAPASNSNWTKTGSQMGQVASGQGGGGYSFFSGDGLVSTGTFDLVDNEFILQLSSTGSGNQYFGIASSVASGVPDTNGLGIYGSWSSTSGYSLWVDGDLSSTSSGSISSYVFIKIAISGTSFTLSSSTDGNTWTQRLIKTLTSDALDLARSMRVYGYTFVSGPPQLATLGSINMLPTPPSTFNPAIPRRRVI